MIIGCGIYFIFGSTKNLNTYTGSGQLAEKKIFLNTSSMDVCLVRDDKYQRNVVEVREYSSERNEISDRYYFWDRSIKEFIAEERFNFPSEVVAGHLRINWGKSELVSINQSEVLINKTKFIQLLSNVKLVELKTACPSNWNGRFVIVKMGYFGFPTFAEVLARAKRLGLEFLNETDKEVVKQFAEFRDNKSLTDKNDYWLGMKPEIMDKKLAMNLVNDLQAAMQCIKLDNSYLVTCFSYENFIFKVPKDLDNKILAERLRTKAWQNKTNDNEFASWFVEPKDPPPVEHRSSNNSSENEENVEMQRTEQKLETNKIIKEALTPKLSSEQGLGSVIINSPFKDTSQMVMHIRKTDDSSFVCDQKKK